MKNGGHIQDGVKVVEKVNHIHSNLKLKPNSKTMTNGQHKIFEMV
jgi:hypothetical protein